MDAETTAEQILRLARQNNLAGTEIEKFLKEGGSMTCQESS